MPTRKTATSEPAITPITDPTLKDVFRWVRAMNDHIYRLDDDILFVGKLLAPFTGERLQHLEDRVAAMETKFETMTMTFTNLIRRLSVIIDMREKDLKK